jgi:hypothetical protein
VATLAPGQFLASREIDPWPRRPIPQPPLLRRGWRRLVILVAALVAGITAGWLASGTHSPLTFAIPVLLLPFALWRWEAASVVLVLATATEIEQSNYTVGPKVSGAWTQHILLFHSLTKGSGVSPAEILFGLILIIWIMKCSLNGTFNLPRSILARAIAVFTCTIFAGMALGFAHGGRFRWMLWEVRPFFYLAFMYTIAASVLTTRKALRAILWTLVLGIGFKAIQGVYIWYKARHLTPRPEAILSHEEAFFFALFIFLTLALYVFNFRGALRRTATVLLPVVMFANLANDRRNSWAVLSLGLIAMLAATYGCLPERRPIVLRLTLLLLVASAAYFPAFWNKQNTIAQPARAVHSAVKPNPRDLSSNLYRDQENANLLYNIRQSHSLGKGFGVPINYALPIVDISGTDPLIAYVPHDGVFYIWMRLGLLGEAIFLSMIGIAIYRTVQLMRTTEALFQTIGAVTLTGLVAYVVQGYNDMGFSFFRIALCMGILLGTVEACLRLAAEKKESVPDVV